jgi:GTP-binding protein
LDAREGVVEQDLHLIGYALEAGRAMVVAIKNGTT